MNDQVSYADLRPGAELAPLTVEVSQVQMFFFSAATYNGHRIHYDSAWAKDVEGYPDLVIHGPLQAALLARLVTDWMGPGGRLVTFSTQNRGSAFLGDRLRFRGQVISRRDEGERSILELELSGEKEDGTVLMPGTATVSLPLIGAGTS